VGQFQFTGFTANTLFQTVQQLSEGFLLSLTVTVTNSGAPVRRGDTFVQVGAQFASAIGSPVFRSLISDYVTTATPLCWPDGNLSNNLAGLGNLHTLALGNPGAGADFTITLTAKTRTWVHSLTATLTTSAAVANRTPVFTIKDLAGNVLWSIAPPAVVVASKTIIYNFGEALTLGTDVNLNCTIPLPSECLLEGAATISSATTNIQAADQWSSVNANIETWQEF
jgi:hypothetical protein